MSTQHDVAVLRPEVPEVEVVAKATRRRFTAAKSLWEAEAKLEDLGPHARHDARHHMLHRGGDGHGGSEMITERRRLFSPESDNELSWSGCASTKLSSKPKSPLPLFS